MSLYIITSRYWQEDTAFALIYDLSDGVCFAYASSEKKVGYGVVGDSVIAFFLQNLAYHGVVPFFAQLKIPKLVCSRGVKNGSFYAGLIRLTVRESERLSRLALLGENPDFSLLDGIRESKTEQEILRLVFERFETIMDETDGLLQAESALQLECKKRGKDIKRDEHAVLLAHMLIKVYNIFVEILPTPLFPPDVFLRSEMVIALLGGVPLRGMQSDLVSRKRLFLLKKNSARLVSIWQRAQEDVGRYKEKYENTLPSLGFCLGERGVEYKRAIFLAPDLMDGDTLLTDIRNNGHADAFVSEEVG